MPPFKDELDAEAGRRLARELVRAWPEFPSRRFMRGLAAALEPLELLARGDELGHRLCETLPASFADGAGVLRGALGSPTFAGWIVVPCGNYVARAGIDDPYRALPLLADLTPRWSSEFAIRPFIEQHPEITYTFLGQWVSSGDEHVRRLVSEGTRPRLPWAAQLRTLAADPTPNLPLLDALADDPSPYVRRSVANHLNDISKDHPDLALELAATWMERGDPQAAAARHGLRTLVKRGDDRALRLIGATVDDAVELSDLAVEPRRVTVGAVVTLTFRLAAPAISTDAVDAVIDYRVHYLGAGGNPKAPKVFKLARRRIPPGGEVTIRRSHRFENVSIRRIVPGRHHIDIQVNGRILGTAAIDVVAMP